MFRSVEAEWLDQLPASSPGAMGSRRDLHRLNTWMGNVATVARALRSTVALNPPPRLLELGAGDGRFMCRVAQRLSHRWQGTNVLLLDRRATAAPDAVRGLAAAGWRLETVQTDALEWLRAEGKQPWDAVVVNLFLHHFAEAALLELLQAISLRANVVVAVEPCRSLWALAASRLVWVTGCNRVTQHDAPVSVRAGFAGQELSRAWPGNGDWSLTERRAGLFSHLLIAQRRSR